MEKLIVYGDMHDVNNGHLVLLMAPSGSGKSVIFNYLREKIPQLHFAVSCTTRAKRSGEKEGEIYHFVSEEVFKTYKEQDLFLEWATYSNNCYGTLKSEIVDQMNNGKVVVREVELQGVQSILQRVPRERITILYINGGTWEELKKRILKREHMSDEELLLRYERYMHETEAKDIADIEIDNSEGKLEDAQKKIVTLMQEILKNNIKTSS